MSAVVLPSPKPSLDVDTSSLHQKFLPKHDGDAIEDYFAELLRETVYIRDSVGQLEANVVTKIIHYKSTKSVQHECLVAIIRNHNGKEFHLELGCSKTKPLDLSKSSSCSRSPDTPCPVAGSTADPLVTVSPTSGAGSDYPAASSQAVDNSPIGPGLAPSQALRLTISSSSSLELLSLSRAWDIIKLTEVSEQDKRNVLERVTPYKPLPLLHFVAIAVTVHRHAESYNLITAQYYWYAMMVSGAVKILGAKVTSGPWAPKGSPLEQDIRLLESLNQTQPGIGNYVWVGGDIPIVQVTVDELREVQTKARALLKKEQAKVNQHWLAKDAKRQQEMEESNREANQHADRERQCADEQSRLADEERQRADEHSWLADEERQRADKAIDQERCRANEAIAAIAAEFVEYKARDRAYLAVAGPSGCPQ